MKSKGIVDDSELAGIFGGEGRLEEAVSVDPTNGAAYYQLAVVYYNLHDNPKALGFLDQAEALFHTSLEWMETIQKFRQLISP